MKLTDVLLSEKKVGPDNNDYVMLTLMMNESPLCVVFKIGATVKEIVNGLRDTAMTLSDGPPEEND